MFVCVICIAAKKSSSYVRPPQEIKLATTATGIQVYVSDFCSKRKPQLARNDCWFLHRFITYVMPDGQTKIVFLSVFLEDKTNCKKVCKKLDNSNKQNLVNLSCLEVQKQDKCYKGKGRANYKLVFNSKSAIA